jgi:hypothetical protein
MKPAVSGRAVALTLQQGKPHQSLDSGEINAPALERVFVLQAYARELQISAP